MDKLPEHVMVEEILLKLPANSLVNLSYVSKDFWSLITSPSFVKLHFLQSNRSSSSSSLLISSHQVVLVKRKCGNIGSKLVIHNYDCNFITNTTSSPAATAAVSEIAEIAEMHLPFECTEIRASCNGLLYLHKVLISWIDGRKIDDITNYIWNPCTKEYKQLPPPPPPLLVDGVDLGNFQRDNGFFHYTASTSGFCGFGYDRNNDEYKILHYENRVDPTYIHLGDHVYQLTLISSIIEFKLYTLGTNTWTPIAHNPYSSFFFTNPSKRLGLHVNGALHWMMSLSDPIPIPKGKIISFDIEKEVFREVQKPRYYSKEEEDEEEDHYFTDSLQILQECLCICKVHSHGGVIKIDIWMLQDYDVMDSWTKLFRVVIPGEKFCCGHFRLLRYCENGEIVMLRNARDVIVYDPVNHKARCAKKFKESIEIYWKYYMDYTESLVCLNSGTYSYRAS